MTGWCITCQIRSGKPTPVEYSLSKPCPHAIASDPAHLIFLDVMMMFVPKRDFVILKDLSEI